MKPVCHADPSGHVQKMHLYSLKFETDKGVNKDKDPQQLGSYFCKVDTLRDKCIGWTKPRKYFSPVGDMVQRQFPHETSPFWAKKL